MARRLNVDSSVHEARLLTASEAAERLGVKLTTLYAYVSRGLLRGSGASRTGGHRYLEEEVLRLALRARARRGHAAVAAGALGFGDPVLSSAITEITERGPRYRGELAVDLAARGAPFEEVVDLLVAAIPAAPEALAPSPRLLRALAKARALADGPHRLIVVATALASPDAGPLAPTTFIRLAAAFGGPRLARAEPTIARALAASFALPLGGRRGAAVLRALDAALVLLADHELNASSFACRVAASTGAEPRVALLAGLAAASGPRHGAASALALASLGERQGTPGLAPAGFGHPLYPKGDPRFAPLLACALELAPRASLRAKVARVTQRAARASGALPNVDLGLAALSTALGAGPALGPHLFFLGRMAGWFAHAREQQAQGTLLRPRARYVGR